MDLRVRDVWSSDIPLTGAYSRYGWSHPGPWMYWLIAPFSLAFGQAAWATLVGSALLQGAAIVWLARLSWRTGGLTALTLWLAIGVSVSSTVGAAGWLEPWNPYIALPFFTLFLLQVWLVALGDSKRLVGAVVVGSFVAQTHVGYVPLIVAPLALALVLMRLDLRRRGQRFRDLAVAKWSALALIVMWLPALIEPLVHPPGNLREVARFFLSGGSGEPSVGWHDAAGILATEFKVLPPWLGGHDLVDPVSNAAVASSSLWLLVPTAAVAVAAVAAWKRDDLGAKRSVALVAVVALTALFTLSRITGTPFGYLFSWRATVGVFAILLSAWAMVTARGWLRGPRQRAAWFTLMSLLVVVPSIATASAVAGHPRAITAYEPVTEHFVDELTAAGQPHRRVLARFAGSALGGVHAGIVDELDRRGTPVFVDDQQPYAFGRALATTPDEVDEVWYVVEDGHALSLLTQRPGASVLVRTTPLDDTDEAEIVDLQRRLAGQLTASGHESRIELLSSTRVADALADVRDLDPGDLQRLEQLNRLVVERGVCRCAVVSFPASAAPS